GYPVSPRGTFNFVPGQAIVNQFGTLLVEVLAPDTLLVPTAKNLSGEPESPALPAVDHFLCHPVQRPRGAPPFTPVLGVRVEDQFGARVVDVIAPTRLCAPGQKNHEEPEAPEPLDHLICYQVQLSPLVIQPAAGMEGPPQIVPPTVQSPVEAIHTHNQFGVEDLTLIDVDELCVPSAKNPTGEPAETINCDAGIFCTEDSVGECEPETDFEPPPSPTPGFTPTPEKGCLHEWKHGDAFGNWLVDGTGENVSPCCEASSDCDDGNPCTHDVCIETEHRCHFEALDPEECGTNPIPPVATPQSAPCVDDATEARLCDIQCIPGQDGEDCPPAPRPIELRPGSADVHHHMFDEDAFGARWRDGSTSGLLHTCDGHGFGPQPHGRVATLAPVLGDLLLCPPIASLLETVPGGLLAFGLVSDFGPPVFSELIGKIEGSAGDTGFHLKRRVPGTGWPRWDVMVHQRGHANTLFKAHQAGLQVIVVTTGGFEPFCELLPPSN